MSVIDTATNAVIATIPLSIGSYALAVTPDGTNVYVANENSGTVSVIATATNTVTADIQRDLVLLGLWTGLREKEAAGLRWDEVDLRNRILHIPAHRMKAGNDFDLPMSDLVHNLLLVRRRIGREGEHVFPGFGRSGHCESFTYALLQIAEATSIKVSPHDLRRTFITNAGLCSISSVARKMLVAHSTNNDVTEGYDILSMDDLRHAAQMVADRFKVRCQITAPTGENVRAFG